MSARQAAQRLGVSRATLYTYASRGLLGSHADPGSARRRRYARDEVEALAARAAARRGHGPVAAGALQWGEPVVDTSISRLDPSGLAYRGRTLDELAPLGFESVAEWLWQAEPGPWPDGTPCPPLPEASPLERMAVALPHLALSDVTRLAVGPRGEHRRGRAIVRSLASLGSEHGTCAERLALGLGGWRAPSAVRLVDRALIASADHGLNASTFAARVTASTGADLYACCTSALATLSGPRHGGSCERIEAFLDGLGSPGEIARAVGERAKRGERLSGFGHRLYPTGDPRARPLIDAARALRPDPILDGLLATMDELGQPPATLDLALVAVARALRMPRGSASALFAVGRAAGWIAHALEQRQQGTLLRPRARYVGP